MPNYKEIIHEDIDILLLGDEAYRFICFISPQGLSAGQGDSKSDDESESPPDKPAAPIATPSPSLRDKKEPPPNKKTSAPTPTPTPTSASTSTSTPASPTNAEPLIEPGNTLPIPNVPPYPPPMQPTSSFFGIHRYTHEFISQEFWMGCHFTTLTRKALYDPFLINCVTEPFRMAIVTYTYGDAESLARAKIYLERFASVRQWVEKDPTKVYATPSVAIPTPSQAAQTTPLHSTKPDTKAPPGASAVPSVVPIGRILFVGVNPVTSISEAAAAAAVAEGKTAPTQTQTQKSADAPGGRLPQSVVDFARQYHCTALYIGEDELENSCQAIFQWIFENYAKSRKESWGPPPSAPAQKTPSQPAAQSSGDDAAKKGYGLCGIM